MATPRSVSFRGLIQNFRRASPPLSYAEFPPGSDYSKMIKFELTNNYPNHAFTGLWGVHNSCSKLFMISSINIPIYKNKSLQIIIIHYFQKINLSLPEKNFQRQKYSITSDGISLSACNLNPSSSKNPFK